MKQYRGERTIDGIIVTVDETSLNPRFDIHIFDEKGFEWSYEGSAPRQLALAILMDHLQDADKALNELESFMASVIANFDNDWTLNSEEIEQSLS